MHRDDASAVTVRLDSVTESKPLSQKKLDQLARARVKSLEVRRRAQKAKLEGKLNAMALGHVWRGEKKALGHRPAQRLAAPASTAPRAKIQN